MAERKIKRLPVKKGCKTTKAIRGPEKNSSAGGEPRPGSGGGKKPALPVIQKTDTEKEAENARKCLAPELQAGVTVSLKYATDKCGELDIWALAAELRAQANAVNKNDLSVLERILVSQISTLDQLFHGYARKSIEGPSLEAEKAYMAMALRAQGQTRAAVETLAEIKNPKPFVQQHNVAYNQQINNGQNPPQSRLEESGPSSRARKKMHVSPNKLLSDRRREYAPMDFGRTQTAGKSYQEVETVGKVDRAAHPRRKSGLQPECDDPWAR